MSFLKTEKQEIEKLEKTIKMAIAAKKKKVPNDPVKFCLDWLGFKPTEYQLKLIKLFQKKQFVAAWWCRQSGKSHIISALLLCFALKNKGCYIAVVGPSWTSRKGMGLNCININDILSDSDKPLIETVGETFEEGLELLSRVGLNDAFLFLRSYEQLSDGQKYRYKIAKMIESKAQFWVMDEFAATLDRDTAKIVAYNFQPQAWRRVMRRDELCGVIVYGYSSPTCFGRKLVVHPKYRTIGLGVKLVKETLAKAGTVYVEMPAVMAKYNPFGEKAGMQKIAEQPPPKEALAIAEILHQLGFNIQLLGSEKYILKKLKSLKVEELARVREAFIKNHTPRFIKYFFPHKPYGKQKLYVEKLMKVSVERLACLIKVCGFLLQAKVYLFWKNLNV